MFRPRQRLRMVLSLTSFTFCRQIIEIVEQAVPLEPNRLNCVISRSFKYHFMRPATDSLRSINENPPSITDISILPLSKR